LHTAISWENLTESDHLAGPGLNGSIILKWTWKNRFGSSGLDKYGFRIRRKGGLC